MNPQIIISGIIALLKFVSLKGWKTLIGAYFLMKRFNLHLLLLFVFLILPELFGSYSYLVNEGGVEWYFAVPSAIGVEAGGSIFTAVNNAMLLHSGEAGISSPLLLAGIFSSITTLFWYIYIWLRFVNFFGGLPPVAWITFGGIIFALMVLITMLVDNYMLAEETLRVSGFTYFLEHPVESLQPLADRTEWGWIPEATNETIQNETLQNTTDSDL